MAWFGRHGDGAEHRPRGRGREPQRVERVGLDDLTPDPIAVLGQAAYLQLGHFEALSRAASTAPTLEAKGSLSAAAGKVLAKHSAIIAELDSRGADSSAAMSVHTAAIDRYFEMVQGADWYEDLASIYFTSGLLDDFFGRITGNLDGGAKISASISSDAGSEDIVQLLADGMSKDPRLASRLAVWGRRLVGDTLLMARSALPHPVNPPAGEARIEPVLTELMADHTRRMDRLGLTA
ncbi:hypothetical protein E6C64_16845 [Naasia lichenicola]|uniref:Ferritin-like domain-containing protein n=1 Tax=Naasia lichenicola TaxID=2565933 RepID=A0A4S4FI07_9MICO|nr:hypothetical protein E6C64_16845 [Naasia lichenicola]